MSVPMPGERQSIGDSHVDKALGVLNTQAKTAAAVMAQYRHSREGTIPMLFADEDVEAMKRVNHLVDARMDTHAYEIRPGISLNIDFSGALMPAFEQDGFKPYHDRIGPLLTFIDEVKAVHDRFEEVKGVLKWFNRNATPGATRAYWPTAMKLTPSAKVWEDLQSVPSRYSEPPNIGDWLQAIRDSAATVASNAMIPADAKPRDKQKMWLTFDSVRVKLSDTQSYKTDLMHYNI